MSLVENSPVRPTDTLANERTFLAHLRTALAFIGFGFVIARFALLERELSMVSHLTVPGKPTSTVFGIAMVIAGVALGLYGAWRYIVTDLGLRRGEVVSMSNWAAALGGVVIAIIGVVVAVDLSRFR